MTRALRLPKGSKMGDVAVRFKSLRSIGCILSVFALGLVAQGASAASLGLTKKYPDFFINSGDIAWNA